LQNYSSFAGAIIEINEDDLLPRAKPEPAPYDRQGKGRPENGSANMSKSIAVSPPGIMSVVDTFWCQAFDCVFEILERAILVLDGCYSSRGPRHKNRQDSILDPGRGDKSRRSAGNVMDIGEAGSLKSKGR
jgi:hypothetical protein